MEENDKEIIAEGEFNQRLKLVEQKMKEEINKHIWNNKMVSLRKVLRPSFIGKTIAKGFVQEPQRNPIGKAIETIQKEWGNVFGENQGVNAALGIEKPKKKEIKIIIEVDVK